MLQPIGIVIFLVLAYTVLALGAGRPGLAYGECAALLMPLSGLVGGAWFLAGQYCAREATNMRRISPMTVGKIVFAAILVSTTATAQVRQSPPASQPGSAALFYQSRFFLAGVLLRAGNVCGDLRMADVGLALIATSELKRVSQTYPETTKQWMLEGANRFNDGVMNDGVQKSCAYAITVRTQAEVITAGEQTPRSTPQPPTPANPIAGIESALREKPWLEGYLRALGVNPRAGPMPPLSPAELRCRATIESLKASNVTPDYMQPSLQQCIEDLRREWMASH